MYLNNKGKIDKIMSQFVPGIVSTSYPEIKINNYMDA